MRVERFTSSFGDRWDQFVADSRNGTFLFLRQYVEHHRDRFEDHSLVVCDERDRLVALLPANRSGTTLVSHGGLTYGGVVSATSMTVLQMAEVFDALLQHLRRESFTLLRYRAVPHIYHRVPSEEDLYVLARNGARLVHRATLSVISSHHPVPPQTRRARGARKANAAGLACRESDDLAGYWAILTEVLWQTYQTTPVHSLEEIVLLQRRFPGHIRFFGCYRAEEMVAGVVVFESSMVARAQYIAASEEGKRLGALDLLFRHLLQDAFVAKPYFELGTSESRDGGDLNRGVLEFKESLGARTVVQDTYELTILPAGS